jgi:hypothetical protein
MFAEVSSTITCVIWSRLAAIGYILCVLFSAKLETQFGDAGHGISLFSLTPSVCAGSPAHADIRGIIDSINFFIINYKDFLIEISYY